MRGRNGFVEAKHLVLAVHVPLVGGEPPIAIEVFSKRCGQLPPVMLMMTSQDAVRLGRALVAAGMGVMKDGDI